MTHVPMPAAFSDLPTQTFSIPRGALHSIVGTLRAGAWISHRNGDTQGYYGTALSLNALLDQGVPFGPADQTPVEITLSRPMIAAFTSTAALVMKAASAQGIAPETSGLGSTVLTVLILGNMDQLPVMSDDQLRRMIDRLPTRLPVECPNLGDDYVTPPGIWAERLPVDPDAHTA